jgi:hypothetical protein
MMMERFDTLVYMFVSLVQNMIISALKTPNIWGEKGIRQVFACIAVRDTDNV